MYIYIQYVYIYIYTVYIIYIYMMYMNYIYMIRNDLGIGLLESGDILFDPSFGLKTWYKPSEQLDSFSESIHVGKAPHIVSISINIYIYVCVSGTIRNVWFKRTQCGSWSKDIFPELPRNRHGTRINCGAAP